jgi:DNA end-binding protein Ku
MADLPLATSKSIEVMHFTPAEQLDPILFNRSYYIEPETAGVRAYALLRDALERSGRVAIAQVALRQRESLATLRSRDGVLVLETLLWPDEVRAADFPFLDDDIDVRSQELRMATSLIDSMTVEFDADEYHDRYREALQELVEAKIEGREVLQPETGEVAPPPSSLADALRASLAAARGGQPDTAEADEEAGDSDGKAATGTKRAAAAQSGRPKSGRAAAGAKDDSTGGRRAKPAGSRRGGKAAGADEDAGADEASGTGGATGRRKAAGSRKAAASRNGTGSGNGSGSQDETEQPATQRRTRRRAS